MQVENDYLSPVEKELLFLNWKKKKGVRAFLLDLDDTACGTRWVFETAIRTASEQLGKRYQNKTPFEWGKELEAINNRLFEKKGVNPNRWNFLIDELAGDYRLEESCQEEIKKTFEAIYTTPLEWLPGAEDGLNFLKKTETLIGVVTHANKDWTRRKYEWLGMSRFVRWDDVYIVDENGHKTDKSWRMATDYFSVRPENCAVVGDSPRSDINPAAAIGVKQLFMVDSHNQWSLHCQPVPPITRIIANLSYLAETGREMRG